MTTINADQRKLMFAIINELAAFTGYTKDNNSSSGILYDQLKKMYFNMYDEPMSLKDGCTIEKYDKFKDMVMEQAFEIGCTFKNNPMAYYDDVEKYLTLCIKHRVCSLTGQPNADIHHTKALGKGIDRDSVDHSKYPRIALGREKHVESHTIGQEAFEKKYHVFGVYCQYHNNKDYENNVGDVIENSDIKSIRYEHVKELLGVQFKDYKEGCNDKNVIVYRMSNKEYDSYINAQNQVEYFYKNIYGTFEIVEL